jgi:DnaJ family protein C protein 7
LAEKLKNEGNTHYASKRYGEAIDLYTRAIELAPKNATYYGNRAAAYLVLSKHREALADSKMATSLDESYVKVNYGLRKKGVLTKKYEYINYNINKSRAI